MHTKLPVPLACGAEDALARIGLRLTSPRRLILQVLAEDGYLYPEAVYRRFSGREGQMSLPTIYRCCLELSRLGVLDRYQFGLKRSLYTLSEEHRYTHMRCAVCEGVVYFAYYERDPAHAGAAEIHDFAKISALRVIQGCCFNCSRNAAMVKKVAIKRVAHG